MAERYFKHKCENEIALEELDENTNKSTKFWLKVWRTGLWRENIMLTLRSIQFCHANELIINK
jgi:hypothetical protein